MLRLNCKIDDEEPKMWTDFQSSNIEGMMYKQDEKQLWIMFKDGSVYAYKNIPFRLAEGLYKAGSKGKFFWNRIRNNPRYQYTKVSASLINRLHSFEGLVSLGGEPQ